jgi:CDP-4-dehydro-6-deoxyglucose reductase, E3
MFKVRLEPSGKEFSAGAQDSLLDAALRAGLAVPYQCAGAVCGNCRARLVSGTVGDPWRHDDVLDAESRAQGQILLCCTRAGSDLVLETLVARRPEDIPVQQIITRVSRLELLSPAVMRILLRTPRSQTLRFLAGQHVTLEIPGLVPRRKSIASAPSNRPHLEFHVQRVAGDPFSDFVFSNLRLNQTVTLTGPEGRFILDDASTRPVIFLAYETGFPVIKSLLEHALRIGFSQPLHLYWVVRPGGTHYQEDACRTLAAGAPNLRYTPVTLPRASSDSARDLMMAAQLVTREYPDLSGHMLYSNGPPDLLSETLPVLTVHGLDLQQLRVDSLPKH